MLEIIQLADTFSINGFTKAEVELSFNVRDLKDNYSTIPDIKDRIKLLIDTTHEDNVRVYETCLYLLDKDYVNSFRTLVNEIINGFEHAISIKSLCRNMIRNTAYPNTTYIETDVELKSNRRACSVKHPITYNNSKVYMGPVRDTYGRIEVEGAMRHECTFILGIEIVSSGPYSRLKPQIK